MKNVLIVTTRDPDPAHGGDKLRILNISKNLSDRYNVHLVCLTDQKNSLKRPSASCFASVTRVYLSKTRSILNCLFGLLNKNPLQVNYYKSSDLIEKIDELCESIEFDFVVCHLIRSAQFILHLPHQKILEMTDVISMNYTRLSSAIAKGSFKKYIYKYEIKKLVIYENSVIEFFNKIVLVSAVDEGYLYERLPNSSVPLSVITNGVEVPVVKMLSKPQSRVIAFIGNINTLQNKDAVNFFLAEIIPSVRAVMPDVQFKIIGKIADHDVYSYQKVPGVYVSGEVDSITMELLGVSVGVCPMRFGAGVQNKILEYMAHAIPTITTSLGYEGLSATIGTEILVSDDPADFSMLIIDLLSNPQIYDGLGRAGCDYVIRNHSWKKVLANYDFF